MKTRYTSFAAAFAGPTAESDAFESDASWRERGLCAQTDPDAFFPEQGASATDAKRICGGCEVRERCLREALARDERFGVWGGLSGRERRRLRQSTPVRPLAADSGSL